jgi:hypothetical protein
MPLRRLSAIILALTPLVVLGLLTAALALQARPHVGQSRVAIEMVSPT